MRGNKGACAKHRLGTNTEGYIVPKRESNYSSQQLRNSITLSPISYVALWQRPYLPLLPKDINKGYCMMKANQDFITQSQQHNEQILQLLSEYLRGEGKELRFNQLMFILNQTQDYFYEEPEETLRSFRATLQSRG